MFKRSLTLVLLLSACKPPMPGAVPGLLGKSRVAVIAQLGTPKHIERVPLDSPIRFQMAAIRALPARLVGAPGLVMEEMRWADGDFYVAVFVAKREGGEWSVVDSFRWHKDITIG